MSIFWGKIKIILRNIRINSYNNVLYRVKNAVKSMFLTIELNPDDEDPQLKKPSVYAGFGLPIVPKTAGMYQFCTNLTQIDVDLWRVLEIRPAEWRRSAGFDLVVIRRKEFEILSV